MSIAIWLCSVENFFSTTALFGNYTQQYKLRKILVYFHTVVTLPFHALCPVYVASLLSALRVISQALIKADFFAIGWSICNLEKSSHLYIPALHGYTILCMAADTEKLRYQEADCFWTNFIRDAGLCPVENSSLEQVKLYVFCLRTSSKFIYVVYVWTIVCTFSGVFHNV